MSLDARVLTLSCINQPGIVAAVSTYLFECGGNIVDAQQFDDRSSQRFFMRVVFEVVDDSARDITEQRTGFMPIVERFGMSWQLRSQAEARRVMILVSKFDHCLADLLYRWRIGEMPMTLTAVVSNHPRETFSRVSLESIPFHHLPIEKLTKLEQESALWALIRDTGTEVVVLARYMQVLSDALTGKLMGRCINIHHSFLPGFKGAKPYHQAHARGVKLIGATAHFVTSDLDEGPIIDQDVERIRHSDSPDDLVRKGRDIESRVLARALRYHLQDRVIINGNKTVVFAE